MIDPFKRFEDEVIRANELLIEFVKVFRKLPKTETDLMLTELEVALESCSEKISESFNAD